LSTRPTLCLSPDLLDAVEDAMEHPLRSTSAEVFPFLPQPSEEDLRAALAEGFRQIRVPVYATAPGCFL